MNPSAAGRGPAVLLAALFSAALALPSLNPAAHAESLGTVHFPVSCKAASQAPFERGVALLHTFDYTQAERQFRTIVAADPTCAMAHWGIAMTQYHELWNHPSTDEMESGVAQMLTASTLATAPKAHITPRELSYIFALSDFFSRIPLGYQRAADSYVAGMASLHAAYPDDVEAAAFYSLALLADVAPDDTSLTKERKALAILQPLFARYPDHPGLAHYIIHAADTPALAQQGLQAAQTFARIAPSSPHATHMPGHIFARLGMWQTDIDSNLASVRASQAAEAHHQPGVAHQLHADEFLIYAYLQTGQDEKARALTASLPALGAHVDSLPGADDMKGMAPYFVDELTALYHLEMHDWAALKTLRPAPGSSASDAIFIPWAQAIAAGHLHDPALAAASLTALDTLIATIKASPDGADAANALAIKRNEALAWKLYCDGQTAPAVAAMAAAADQQDKLGQGEVDLPAREMLGDLYLALHRPQDALAAYKTSLTLSPNRLNGLLGAGEAAAVANLPKEAAAYFAMAAANTNNAATSSRTELLLAVHSLGRNPTP